MGFWGAAWWLERRRHADYAQKLRVEMKIDLKAEMAKLADEFGLDPDEALEEVTAILAGR